MAEGSGERRRGLQFDGTINLGHFLTALAMLAGLLGWGFRLEARVDGERDRRTEFGEQYQRDQSRDREATRDIRDSLRRIEDKLDRKADRPFLPAPN